MLSPAPLFNAPKVLAVKVTVPALLRSSAVTAAVEAVPKSPPVPLTTVPSPRLAAGTEKLNKSIVVPAAAPNKPPVPTRRNKTFGTVIWKSRRALVVSGPVNAETVADSAEASIGAPVAMATTAAARAFFDVVLNDFILVSKGYGENIG